MAALRLDGNVVFWGDVPQAGLFLPGSLRDITAIAAGRHYVTAVRRNGTVVQLSTGDGSSSTGPAGLSGVVAVAQGLQHALALKSDGTVLAWGSNSAGQSTVPDGLGNVVAVAASDSSSFALKADGTVVAWGFGWMGLTNTSGLSNIRGIAAGSAHALAVGFDGKVTAWGDNLYLDTVVPPGLEGVKAVVAGTYNSYALNPAPLLEPVIPYQFSGFQSPVDSAPVINIGMAGCTYPVKCQLKNQVVTFVSALSAV